MKYADTYHALANFGRELTNIYLIEDEQLKREN